MLSPQTTIILPRGKKSSLVTVVRGGSRAKISPNPWELTYCAKPTELFMIVPPIAQAFISSTQFAAQLLVGILKQNKKHIETRSSTMHLTFPWRKNTRKASNDYHPLVSSLDSSYSEDT